MPSVNRWQRNQVGGRSSQTKRAPNSTSRLPPMRLRPQPPAFDESRKANWFWAGSLKSLTCGQGVKDGGQTHDTSE